MYSCEWKESFRFALFATNDFRAHKLFRSVAIAAVPIILLATKVDHRSHLAHSVRHDFFLCSLILIFFSAVLLLLVWLCAPSKDSTFFLLVRFLFALAVCVCAVIVSLLWLLWKRYLWNSFYLAFWISFEWWCRCCSHLLRSTLVRIVRWQKEKHEYSRDKECNCEWNE